MYLTSKHVYLWPQHPCIQFKNVVSDMGVSLLLSAFHHKESTHLTPESPLHSFCVALKSLRSCVFIRGSVLTRVTSGYILRFVRDWNHSHRMTPSSFGIFFCNDHKKLLPPLLLLTGSGSVATPKLPLYITQFINSLRPLFLPCFIWFYCKSVP